MDEQNIVYSYNGRFFSHKKELNTATWNDLDNIKPSEGSKNKMPHIIKFHLCVMSRIGKPTGVGSRSVGTWNWVEGIMGSYY